MAKKQKFEDQTTDTTTTAEELEPAVKTPELEPVVKTPEQVAIAEALVNGTLQDLHDAEGTTDKLKTLIVVYTSLLGALGEEAGATIAAKANLEAYTPDKVKGPKVAKEKAFNEVKALKDALATEDTHAALEVLVVDERISENLKNAIITYTTLAGLPLDQAIIDGALETLSNFGRKGGTRTGTRAPSGPREHFNVEVNGVTHATLTGAIAAQGILKEITEGNKTTDADIAWRTIRPKLLKDGVAVYNEVTYTKVPVAEVEPEAPAEVEPEAPAEVEPEAPAEA